MLDALSAATAPLGARNRAMLLLGFGAALRRSELVAFKLGDMEPVPGRGLRLLIRRSKTDPQARGEEVAVWTHPAEPRLYPAAALETWRSLRAAARDLAPTLPAAKHQEWLLTGFNHYCLLVESVQINHFSTRLEAQIDDLMRSVRQPFVLNFGTGREWGPGNDLLAYVSPCA